MNNYQTTVTLGTANCIW